MSGRTRTEYRHGNVEREAVEVGLSLLRDGDIERLSLRRVAEGVGVTHGALYRHFEDRDAFLDRLATHGFRELTRIIASKRSVKGFVSGYVGFASDNAELYDLMMARPNARFGQEGGLRDSSRALLEVVRSVFGDAPDDAIVRTWMLVHGAVGLRQAGIMKPLEEAAFVAYVTKLAAD